MVYTLMPISIFDTQPSPTWAHASSWALAAAMVYARDRYMDESATVRQILDRVLADIDSAGLDALEESPMGDRAAFRAHELAAAINRLRTLQVEQMRR